MDLLEVLGNLIAVIIVVFIVVVVMAGIIKYVKEPTVRDIQEHYILYNGKIYKELDIENVEELLQSGQESDQEGGQEDE